MEEFRLTERQRSFAADNHYVLEEYLQRKNLPLDDFYDVVVFGYLRAVKHYDESEDVQPFGFRAVAEDHMYAELCGYMRKQKLRNKNVRILSLDRPVSTHLTLGDVIADERADVFDTVCRKLSPKHNGLSDISFPVRPLSMAA